MFYKKEFYKNAIYVKKLRKFSTGFLRPKNVYKRFSYRNNSISFRGAILCNILPDSLKSLKISPSIKILIKSVEGSQLLMQNMSKKVRGSLNYNVSGSRMTNRIHIHVYIRDNLDS